MLKRKTDPEREDRITYDIIVDCYDEIEQALGWYCYLEEKCSFPFKARCIAERSISILKSKEEVKVIKMAPEDECEHEMFVEIIRKGEELVVPLSQIEPIEADKKTQEAIEDWHYWVNQGYQL